MNFGGKFPYALLTFSQKFVEAGYWWYTLSQQLVRLIVPRTHTFSKKLSRLIIGYTTPPSHHVPKKHTANPAPSIPHTPTSQPNTHTQHTTHINSHAPHPIHPHPIHPHQPYTHHTLAIHPPHTPPPAS